MRTCERVAICIPIAPGLCMGEHLTGPVSGY